MHHDCPRRDRAERPLEVAVVERIGADVALLPSPHTEKAVQTSPTRRKTGVYLTAPRRDAIAIVQSMSDVLIV
jgi:hypothetical protein